MEDTNSTCHVRSSSLPSQRHPILSHLMEASKTLRAWRCRAIGSTSSSTCSSHEWLLQGVSHLHIYLSSLNNLLQLPRAQHSSLDHRCIRHSNTQAQALLDNFLVFADAYGAFREAMVSLRELTSSAQVAARRKDKKALSTYHKAVKKAQKEMLRIVGLLSNMEKTQEPSSDGKLMAILKEARGVVVWVSASVFTGLTALSSLVFSEYTSSVPSPLLERLGLRRTKISAEEEKNCERRLEEFREFEKCLLQLECESEKVFRCLLNTRVALLNMLTP